MNMYKKITLALVFSVLSASTRAAQSATEMATYHEGQAELPKKIAEVSFTWLFTNGWFEMLYKELDKKDHVPANWKFARRINPRLIALSGIACVSASTVWGYHACLVEHYKQESKKWFWQREAK